MDRAIAENRGACQRREKSDVRRRPSPKTGHMIDNLSGVSARSGTKWLDAGYEPSVWDPRKATFVDAGYLYLGTVPAVEHLPPLDMAVRLNGAGFRGYTPANFPGIGPASGGHDSAVFRPVVRSGTVPWENPPLIGCGGVTEMGRMVEFHTDLTVEFESGIRFRSDPFYFVRTDRQMGGCLSAIRSTPGDCSRGMGGRPSRVPASRDEPTRQPMALAVLSTHGFLKILG